MNDIILPQRGMLHSSPRPMISRPARPVIRRAATNMKVTPQIHYQKPATTLVIQDIRHGVHNKPTTPTHAQTLHTSPTVAERPSVPRTLSSHIDVPKTQSRRRRSLRRLFSRNAIAGLVVALILAGTGYVGIDTWLTNNRVKSELTATASTSSGAVTGSSAADEGRDETPLPANAVDTYKVAADLPRALTINKLNINARILPMSVNADGSMQAPKGIYDSGWYTGSAKPGTPGAAVIDGHASGSTHEGLFGNLDSLKIGDTLSVERGDGTILNYKVTFIETVALDKVDMGKLLLPYGQATEGLNLITCTGKWVQDKKTFDHRILIYTERVS